MTAIDGVHARDALDPEGIASGQVREPIVPRQVLASILDGAASAARRACGADGAVAMLPARGDLGDPDVTVRQDGRRIPPAAIRAAARLVHAGSAVLIPDLARDPVRHWRTAADAGIAGVAAVLLQLGPDRGCLLVACDMPGKLVMSHVVALREVSRLTARAHLGAAAEAGQQRLAGYLHDCFGQTLTAIVFAVDRLSRGLGSDEHRALASVVREHAVTAVRQLREVLDQGITTGVPACVASDVGRLLDELAGAGIAFRFTDRLGSEDLPPGVAACICQVAREALLNIRRHAHARVVEVSVWRRRHSAGVSIRDDGRGLQPAESRGRRWGGLGLALMRKRVEDIGGRFSIQSIPGKGTRIAASIPCLS
jgi:signal transduction histidine kinase